MHDGTVFTEHGGRHRVELLNKGKNRGDENVENKYTPLGVKSSEGRPKLLRPLQSLESGGGVDFFNLDLPPKNDTGTCES